MNARQGLCNGARWVAAGCVVLILLGMLWGCAKKSSYDVGPIPLNEGVRRGYSTPGNLSDPKTSDIIPVTYSSEELWVITRGQKRGDRASDEPGSGALLAKIESKEIPMPLKHTDVHASIAGYISAVEVTQQFLNPYASKIEAVYVFPLPHDAAINEFVMTIGDRHIRGIIREREEARQIYEQARSQGYVASLLTEERPNIFSQSVANIEPGKEIDVHIKYLHTLEYAD